MKKADILGLHERFLLKFGFTLNKEHLVFEKTFTFHSQLIFINYSENENYRTLEYKMGIHINPVEDLVIKYLPYYGSFTERSMTIVQPLYRLGSKCQNKFVIPRGQNLNTTIRLVELFFAKEGFTWFEKMSDPRRIEKEFLSQKDNPLTSPNFLYTAYRSTALSRLFNPEHYLPLRNLYLSQIHKKGMTPFAIGTFLQFLNHLDNLTVN